MMSNDTFLVMAIADVENQCPLVEMNQGFDYDLISALSEIQTVAQFGELILK